MHRATESPAFTYERLFGPYMAGVTSVVITEPYLARMSSLKTRKRAADASDLDPLSSDEDASMDAPVQRATASKSKKPAPPAPPARTAGAGRGRR